MPLDELRRRILGAAGALYEEVERPGPHAGISLPGGPRLGLTYLTFAAVPRATGFAGLCQADIAFVGFRSVRPPSDVDYDPPARVSNLSTSRWYRIVSDAEPVRDADWTSRNERLERSCRRSGPVFASGERQRFFGGEAFGIAELRPADASFAARALQQSISLASAGRILPACAPHPSFSAEELCGDPARRLSQLRPADVSRVVLDRCSAAASNICVTVSFMSLPDWTPWSARFIEVRIETGAAVVDPPPGRFTVRHVSLNGRHIAV